MKKHSPLLMVVLLIFTIGIFAACSAQEAANNENNGNPSPEIGDPSALRDTDNIKEVNLYLNGIKNSLHLSDSSNILLLEGLSDSLTEAEANTEILNKITVDTPIDLKNAYTCLEVVYNDQILLPFAVDEQNFLAQSVVYAINVGDTKANIVADDENIICGIDNNLLSEIINEYVDNIMTLAKFSTSDRVTVAGLSTNYLIDQSDNIPEPMLSRLLYNAVAFYQNCYNANLAGNENIITDELQKALEQSNGNSTGHGEDTILNMSQYFSYAKPVSLQVLYGSSDEEYIVNINVDNFTTLSIVFLEEDGYPYIDACHMMSV